MSVWFLFTSVKCRKKPRRRNPLKVRKENSHARFWITFFRVSKRSELTDQELIRAIRFAVASEYEATQLYMQLAESTNNKLAVKVLKEIADEELVHVGEFLRLLRELAPDEEKFYAKGAKEVEEKIQKKK